MLDWLLDPFGGAIMRRALAEVLLLGAACGPLGVWVLLYRQAYAAESVSHAMLPGLVLAALAGLPLLTGAVGGVLAAAAAIALAARDERVGPDVAVAVAITFLFGLGAILALSPASPPRLEELLFGDLLGLTGRDVAEAALLTAGIAAALAAAFRFLSLAAFDPAAARSLGAPPGRWQLALLALLGLCAALAARGLGNLLLVALIVAPGVAALRVAARLPVALVIAAALAWLAGLAGLLVSYHLELAAGASVALCAVALAALALVLPARGAVSAP